MIDYFLKFPDQPTALEVLRPLGMTYIYTEPTPPEIDPETGRKMIQMTPIYPVGEERISQGGHQWAIWCVGEIEGVEGFHVNLRLIDPELDVSSLEPYAVTPRNPRCVWA
jgi:hypothetical protein